MSTRFTLVKILPEKQNKSSELKNNILRMDNISSSGEMNEFVVLYSGSYENIFKRKLKDSGTFRKLLSVVKITYRDEEGEKRSIHRAFRAESANGLDHNCACLSPQSIALLSKDGSAKEGDSVFLSKGNLLKFFFFHPNRAVLSATWIGAIGIAFSLIGILLSFFGITWESICSCVSRLFTVFCDCNCNCCK